MANMRIIHSNMIDAGSNLASSPACVGTMPITNLRDPRRGMFARVVGATTWTISGEFVGAVSGMALVGHNLTGNATVRLRLYSDYAKIAQVYDSGALAVGTPQTWGNPAASPNGGLEWGVTPWLDTGLLPGTPEYFTHWFPHVSNAVAFSLTMSDTSNSDGFLQIGRVYLGSYWSPTLNFTYGASMAWKEPSVQSRTDGGSLRTEGYLPYRVYKLTFDCMDETDRAYLVGLIRKLGKRVDFLMSLYPTEGGTRERDYTAACKFVSLPEIPHNEYDRFTASVEMEEI